MKGDIAAILTKVVLLNAHIVAAIKLEWAHYFMYNDIIGMGHSKSCSTQ